MKITKFAVLALVAVFCTNGLALAKHTTTHFNVTAKVDPSCDNFSVADINFGTLNALPPYTQTTSTPSTISYRCTLGTDVTLAATGNCTNPSDSDTNWAMCDTSGHYIDFGLYEAASTIPDCGTGTSAEQVPGVAFSNDESPGVDAGSGYQDSTQTLCAVIPTDPSPSTGAIWVGDGNDKYVDHITVTLTY